MMLPFLDRAMGRGFKHDRIQTDSLIWLDEHIDGGLQNAIEGLNDDYSPEKRAFSRHIEHMNLSKNTPISDYKRPGQRL